MCRVCILLTLTSKRFNIKSMCVCLCEKINKKKRWPKSGTCLRLFLSCFPLCRSKRKQFIFKTSNAYILLYHMTAYTSGITSHFYYSCFIDLHGMWMSIFILVICVHVYKNVTVGRLNGHIINEQNNYLVLHIVWILSSLSTPDLHSHDSLS